MEQEGEAMIENAWDKDNHAATRDPSRTNSNHICNARWKAIYDDRSLNSINKLLPIKYSRLFLI